VWTNGGIHSAAQFLPWHRWYLNQLEDVLRKVVPGITIPYWAWEDEPRGQQFSSSFWDADIGFGGGRGGGASGQCVPDGKLSARCSALFGLLFGSALQCMQCPDCSLLPKLHCKSNHCIKPQPRPRPRPRSLATLLLKKA
jgi:hypothetical protein